MLTMLPMAPTMQNITAMPEPLPVPKTGANACCKGEAAAMKGSKTWSASTPPRNIPKGIVQFCRVSRAEKTRPCISIGTWVRITAVRLAPRIATGI